MKKYILPFILLALLFSCKSENEVGGNDAENGNGNVVGNELSITIGAEHISAVSAILKGKANLGSTVASDLSMGIMWSVNAGVLPSNSTKVEATNMDGSYNYSVGITVLEPETTYYYRSYVTQNGQDTYGETKEFTTKDVASLLETRDASGVEAAKATLNAKLDLTDVSYSNLEYGFYWGTSETSQDKKLDGGRIINNEYSALLTDLEPNTRYWFKAYAKLDGQTLYGAVKSFTTENVPVVTLDAIDLGIVVNGKKIKWGSFNLGATKPEEYGDYYAWGETETKEKYSWSTYKFGTVSGPFSKYNTISSYGSIDNKTVLEPEDDVAHVKLGGSWRMPTDAEWTELLTQCTWTWTTYNGVNGRLATATNGNSIFLPAAGPHLHDVSPYGAYWSSSLDTDYPDSAWGIYFGSSDIDCATGGRELGQSVRPVYEE